MRTVTGVDLLLDVRAELAEGPHWDVDAQRLLWVDINPGTVHLTDLSTGAGRAVRLGPTVGAAVPRAGGGMVVATEDRFALYDASGEPSDSVVVHPFTDGTRMNDGKCDPAGRFWAGTMVLDKDAPRAALYRLDPDLMVHRMVEGVTVSNGLAWSLDATRMYFIDSLAGGIDEFRYDLASGAIDGRRRIITIPSSHGEPDGMTIDADGCLWIALWGGSQVRRYTPDGRLDAVVELPVSLVTSCTFAGPSMDVLCVTTASCDLTPDQRREQPHAGGIFAADVGTSGLAPARFG